MANYKVGMVIAIVALLIVGSVFGVYVTSVGPVTVTTTVTGPGGARTVTTTVVTTRTVPVTVTATPAANLTKIAVGLLAPPSQGSWPALIIQELGLDRKYGIEIEWVFQPGTAALYNDFTAGRYKIGHGGFMTFANMYARGVPAKVFATLTLFGTALIINKERAPDVNTVRDLEGKLVAGPLAAENTRAMQVYMRWLGADLARIQFQNFEHAAVVTELTAPTGRAVAGIGWETVPSRLEMQDPRKYVSLFTIQQLEQVWRERTGTKYHFLLGIAAWDEVLRTQPAIVERVYLAHRDAAKFIMDFPEEALKIISRRTGVAEDILRDAFEKDRLRFLVKPAHMEKDSILKLLTETNRLGFVERVPDDAFFYTGIRASP
ncbi:MAG: ABC transporter substrate-binding protein [Aigarchaeota archaeon]|nr:ABC transporter substrate-binding protein [Aigarchaeota archaeon]MDW8092711.1 ABC transporter substrate-binding protein [Nitrososphaerota archaeon]